MLKIAADGVDRDAPQAVQVGRGAHARDRSAIIGDRSAINRDRSAIIRDQCACSFLPSAVRRETGGVLEGYSQGTAFRAEGYCEYSRRRSGGVLTHAVAKADVIDLGAVRSPALGVSKGLSMGTQGVLKGTHGEHCGVHTQ